MLNRLLLVSSLVTASFAQSTNVRIADTESLRRALGEATPGTTIVVSPGDYRGFAAANVRGTARSPIVVRAEDPVRPPHFTSGIHLSDVEHFEVDGLLLTDSPTNGINVDDGGSFDSPAHHVVLRRVTVRDIGGRGNHDGIKLSGVDDFLVVDCTIERWGRSGSGIDMVGCHRGAIEACTLRDRDGGTAANGVQMKGGTRDVAVRRCRFEHAGERAVQLGGSTGREFFRPKVEGFEARDLVVEGCTFIGATAPIAFVGCDGARVHHNTIWLPAKWVLRILQETKADDFVPCRNGAFTDNVIVMRGVDVVANVGPDTAADTFTFARNWWYRVDAPGRSMPRLPVAETDPAGGSDPKFVDAEHGDLRLASDSPARGRGADALPPPAKGNAPAK